jgi:cytochrome P450
MTSTTAIGVQSGKPLPSGPKGSLLLGNLGAFRQDMTGFLEASARHYGDAVPLRFANMRFVLLNDPDAIEEVLVRQNKNFVKNITEPVWWALLGNGLLLSDGEFWLRQRRLMQPVFHRQRIADYGRTMVDLTVRRLNTWQEGDVRDLQDELMQLTLAVVAKTLFGADVAGQARDVGRALEVVLREFSTKILQPIPVPMRVPTPGNLRFRRAVARLDEIIFEVIRSRRAAGEADDAGDLLSLLLRAQDEDGSRMTDKQLRDEVMTLFLAGHETTANAISWALYLLARNPSVEDRLVSELDEVLAGAPPSVESLGRLPYAANVVKETLRLYPPVWTLEGRRAVQDCVIGGYRIRAGTVMLLSPWVSHRDPRRFEEADRFQPDRWTEEFTHQLPRYAYFPFGGGQRLCIGQSFAEMEATLILASLVQRFRLATVSDEPAETAPSVTLRPKGGLPMRIEARRPAGY